MREKRDTKNAGFSLVEFMVVVAIMAILAGLVGPALVTYVRKSRRVVDVDTADEVRKAFERKIISYDPGSSVHEIGWEYTTAVAWNKNTTIDNGDPKTILDYVFQDVSTVPISKTNKDWFWVVDYNPNTCEVKKISLTPSLGGKNNPSYQLYPDPKDFLEGKNVKY